MSKELVERWIRPEVRALSAYHVQDASGFIKLDAMENPYTLSESLIDEWLQQLRSLEINRYPDAGAKVLKDHLRDYLELGAEQDVLLGNGSDELIQMIVMAVASNAGSKQRVVLAPEPGFVMYRLVAQSLGMKYVGVSLNEGDFSLDLDAMLQAIEQHKPAVIFLAYPNNPTGNLFDRQDIETIIAATDGLVIIDEAYYSFAETTWIKEFQRFDNVLVMRTLSKIGLAGLRIGMLVGANNWLDEFNKIRLPYNINALSQASATFMLKHVGVFDRQAAQIRADRQMMFEALNRFSRLTVWPSRANFLLIKSEQSQTIFDKLKEQKILIKNLGGVHSMLENCLRITIGSEHENQAILASLGSIEQLIP